MDREAGYGNTDNYEPRAQLEEATHDKDRRDQSHAQ